jgi:hypothetical protein
LNTGIDGDVVWGGGTNAKMTVSTENSLFLFNYRGMTVAVQNGLGLSFARLNPAPFRCKRRRDLEKSRV